MNGILLIDKPEGWTSHDVVAKVRSVLKKSTGQKVKVGHSGTLDPAATGLLVLLLGSYTKKAREFSRLDKTYEAELTLGSVSTTGDKEGEIAKMSDRKPSESEIKSALDQFKGEISQIPHSYSAVKVGGKRAYKLARAGEKVELEPRRVTIYDLRVNSYEYPKLNLTAKVSSGTYIRSLAEDIGEKLGTDAYLSALRRTQVGEHKLKNAIRIKDLELGIDKLYDK